VRLPEPPTEYSDRIERERNRELEQEDEQNLKRNREIEFPYAGPSRIVLRSPDGTRFWLRVDDEGELTTTSLDS
jgi:hypothetical protein